MGLPLKEIPFENGSREPLSVCQACFGCGTSRTSLEPVTLKGGRTIAAGTPVNDELAKVFKRGKMKVASCDCKTCGGAGIVKKVAGNE